MKVWIITREECLVGELSGEEKVHFGIEGVYDNETKAEKELKKLNKNADKDKDYFARYLNYCIHEENVE